MRLLPLVAAAERTDATVLATLLSRPRSVDDAAYIIMTSGSTGLPKAVLTGERQLLADTDHIVAAMGITGDLGKLFASHPPLEERIAALQAST